MSTRTQAVQACAAVGIALVLIGLAFVPAHRALAGVTFPYDPDQFRDIAAAQAILDGEGIGDPLYRGETIWYNPMVAALVAATTVAVGSTDVPAAYIAAGPYLNLLGPVAFFGMTFSLCGAWPAVVALALYLFAPFYLEPWASPSYSQWIFPCRIGIAFFCVGLIACRYASARTGLRWWLLSGTALGLTFLTHTAPAMLLGLCGITALLTNPSLQRATLRVRMQAAVALYGTALVTSSPFLFSILARYHLHIVNDAPTNWVWPDIDVHHVTDVLAAVISPWALPALAGLGLLLSRVRREPAARLAVTWLTGAAALFLYGWIQQTYPRLPSVVPQFHFFFYLTAAAIVLISVGIVAAIDRAIGVLRSRGPDAGTVALAGLTVTVVVSAILLRYYPAYQDRPDFHEYQREALQWSQELRQSDVVRRLRQQTPPDAVILASPEDSLYRVATAGRFVVAVRSEFSNPYVPFAAREAAQDEMMSAAVTGDAASLRARAQAFGVTHVLLGPADQTQLASHGAEGAGMRLLSEQHGYGIYALESAPDGERK